MSGSVTTGVATTTQGNPLVAQGTLNRLRGSVVIPSFPSLNVTASYLGKAGIVLTLEGNTTDFIDTMVGGVTSPAPYQKVSVVVNLLKTQQISTLYKQQMESLALVGDITVTTDSSIFPTYDFVNCAIESVREMSMAGDDAGYVITIGGYYNINNNLWNLA